MADLSITAANVTTSSTTTTLLTAGETLTAGQCVYQKASDSKAYKSQCDGTTEEATVLGIALNGASANQPVLVQTGGDITIGATVTVAATYVVSAAAGGIAPVADLVSTNKLSYIGYGKTSSVLTISRQVTGVAVP